MIIATAGHIDHGKTSLIRALTGADTDRLPEERARGISIDLGFAHWHPRDKVLIGFVDVPGHERFVRNMLAGVAGANFALLVVAADDGPMPQTIEHLEILDLLGFSRGVVALTKSDRVSAERLDEVRMEIGELLSRHSLAKAPIVSLSSVTGAGVPELASLLIEAAEAEIEEDDSTRNFRMAIDRVFTVPGAGTVATGTILEGRLQSGDRLCILPAGKEVRVRSIQRAGIGAERARPGERAAVNIAGADLAEARRGSWLVAPEMGVASNRIDARLNILTRNLKPLKHDSRVHLHIGTADIPARILVAKQQAIEPGKSAIVSLLLDQPTIAVTGDRFVIRDQSGRNLVGGGTIIAPVPRPKRRKDKKYEKINAALESGAPNHALSQLLSIEGHEIDAETFRRSFNLTASFAAALFEASETIALGDVLIPQSRAEQIRTEISDILATFHREQPEAAGMRVHDLHQKISVAVSREAFAALVRAFISDGLIEASGSSVKIRGHSPAFSPFDAALWQRLLPWLEERGPRLFTAAEAARETRTNEASVQAMLFRRRASGDVWKVTKDQFMLHQHVAGLAASAAELSSMNDGDGFTAASYRDHSGIGRNLTIKILEFLDTIGVTARRGDKRRIAPLYEQFVGTASPIRAPSATA